MRLCLRLAAALIIALCTPPRATLAGVDGQPQLQVDAQIGGRTTALVLDGTSLYLGIGSRLDVLDISRPVQPVVKGVGAPLPAPVASVTTSNGFAFVADGPGGLHVLDVHDPTQPIEVTALDVGGSVARVAVVDSIAYVAASEAGLHIFDVSDPTAPQEIGSYTAAFGVLDVAVMQSTAYVAVDEGTISRGTRVQLPRLRTLDVSDPTNPVELGIADVSAFPGLASSLMLVDGGHVYEYFIRNGASGCESAGIHVLDVSDPTAPTNTGDLPAECNANSIAGTGTLFALGTQFDSVWLYRPGAENPRTEVHPGIQASALALANSSLYVAGLDEPTGQSAVRVLDLARGNPPPLAGAYNEPALAHAQGTAVGRRVYLADRGRFSIVDVGRPDKPTEVGSAGLSTATSVQSNWSADVLVANNYAYVVDGKTLKTFSLADPTHPVMQDQQDLGVGIFGIARSGANLYVIAGVQSPPGQFGLTYQLDILDVMDPAHPRLTGTWTGASGLWTGLAASGSYVYLVAGRSLQVLDLEDPLHPQIVGSAPFNDVGGDRLAVVGTTVFVNSFGGVVPYDVSVPTQPQMLSTFGGDGGMVSSVAADGAHLDVAYWSGQGVRVFDVSDPGNPLLLGAYAAIPNGEVAASVFAADGQVVTSTYSGLWVLQLPLLP